jgi:alpha-galactosidase
VEFCLKSLIGTLPIMLGDPREVPQEKREMLHSWSDWMREMQEKYNYMAYRKDLAGFGEPKEGSWDGWQRINFQTNHGGIFGVFRQGALEDTRTIFLKDLKPEETYVIRRAPDGKAVHQATGESLMHKSGFPVKMEEKYEGRIYEVRLKDK